MNIFFSVFIYKIYITKNQPDGKEEWVGNGIKIAD